MSSYKLKRINDYVYKDLVIAVKSFIKSKGHDR